MRAAPFDYLAPRDITDVLTAFDPDRQVVLLAGGQSLVPALNRRQVRPDVVVDLNGVTALAACVRSDRELRLGALTRHRSVELDETIGRRLPVLATAAGLIGDPGVRRRGTVGGSLVQALPGAQLPVLAVLLDAQIDLLSAAGQRSVAARQFLLGPSRTDLRAGEVLASVRFPWTGLDEGCAVHRCTAQRHGRDITAAVRIRRDAAGRCRSVRMVVGAGRPVLVDLTGSDLVHRGDLPAGLSRSVALRVAGTVARQDYTVRPDDGPLVAAAIGAALTKAWRMRDG